MDSLLVALAVISTGWIIGSIFADINNGFLDAVGWTRSEPTDEGQPVEYRYTLREWVGDNLAVPGDESFLGQLFECRACTAFYPMLFLSFIGHGFTEVTNGDWLINVWATTTFGYVVIYLLGKLIKEHQ